MSYRAALAHQEVEKHNKNSHNEITEKAIIGVIVLVLTEKMGKLKWITFFITEKNIYLKKILSCFPFLKNELHLLC